MTQADYSPSGYGFKTYAEAVDTIDEQNAPIGSTFKICGMIYILTKDLTFEKV